jgi:hypothetical protein
MATDQQNDQEIQNYRTAISNLRLEDVPFENGAFILLCDVSTGVARPTYSAGNLAQASV